MSTAKVIFPNPCKKLVKDVKPYTYFLAQDPCGNQIGLFLKISPCECINLMTNIKTESGLMSEYEMYEEVDVEIFVKPKRRPPANGHQI